MRYLLALRARWLTIAAVTVAAMVATAIVTGLILTKWYRAAALVRPISMPAVENRVMGNLGGLGGGLAGYASMLAGGSNDSEEYMGILRGFRFNVTLADHHQLKDELLVSAGYDPGRLKPNERDWKVYRILEDRFDCDYAITTGNITLHFEAPSPAEAERILGYYLDDLRELLRARQVRDAGAAIDSLEEEAKATVDPLARTQLSELVTKQIQLKKLAQVEADFAFRVLDPPASPEKPYSPRPLFDSALMGLLALLVSSLAVLAAEGRPSFSREAQPPVGLRTRG
jgi:LPS O-antigen subunit length determinant protein (WzzB/FepE family)